MLTALLLVLSTAAGIALATLGSPRLLPTAVAHKEQRFFSLSVWGTIADASPTAFTLHPLQGERKPLRVRYDTETLVLLRDTARHDGDAVANMRTYIAPAADIIKNGTLVLVTIWIEGEVQTPHAMLVLTKSS